MIKWPLLDFTLEAIEIAAGNELVGGSKGPSVKNPLEVYTLAPNLIETVKD